MKIEKLIIAEKISKNNGNISWLGLTLFGWPPMSCPNAKLVFDYDYDIFTINPETTREGINYG